MRLLERGGCFFLRKQGPSVSRFATAEPLVGYRVGMPSA